MLIYVVLLILISLFASCNGGNMPNKIVSSRTLNDVPKSKWEALSQKRIFFGHQSVGYNIIDGIKNIMQEHSFIKLKIIEFKAIVLPAPVAPATSKCGILAKSAKNGLPITSFPIARTRGEGFFLNSGKASKFPVFTFALILFGTSIPTSDLPGIGASILIGWEAKDKARSFAKDVIFESFIPSAGFKVYWVKERAKRHLFFMLATVMQVAKQ